MTITAELINFWPTDTYEVHWEYSEDRGKTYKDTGATGMTYTVVLTMDNQGYYWRAVVYINP